MNYRDTDQRIRAGLRTRGIVRKLLTNTGIRYLEDKGLLTSNFVVLESPAVFSKLVLTLEKIYEVEYK